MAFFRVTIRYGSPRQRYEMLDIEAGSVVEALTRLAERFPSAARATGDLVEIRRQPAPDEREYTPG